MRSRETAGEREVVLTAERDVPRTRTMRLDDSGLHVVLDGRRGRPSRIAVDRGRIDDRAPRWTRPRGAPRMRA